MKIDKGSFINDFIDKNLRQYSIPVYQRNYEWSAEQCEKLFEDILQAHELDRYHFTGSVVYELLKTENKIDYYVIIDGQQRLTTIYILLKALIDVAETEAEKDTLLSLMFNQDKFKKYNIDDSSKLKLKPIKSDNQQLMLLMENRIDKMDKSSGIYKNYDLFCKLAKKALQENPALSIERIYDGVEHLTCAMIKLEEEEQGKEQEIFERINSTGVPLSLADKIRNFVLMTEVDQDRLYEEYWIQIEQMLSKEQMSAFFLDYLNFKLDGFTREKEAYDDFKTVYRKNNYTNVCLCALIAALNFSSNPKCMKGNHQTPDCESGSWESHPRRVLRRFRRKVSLSPESVVALSVAIGYFGMVSEPLTTLHSANVKKTGGSWRTFLRLRALTPTQVMYLMNVYSVVKERCRIFALHSFTATFEAKKRHCF